MSPHRTHVKVCGLTRAQDAEAAARAGAAMLGVILDADSPRRIGIEEASRVFAHVDEAAHDAWREPGGELDAGQNPVTGVTRVGVFVNSSELCVAEAVERLHLDYVQFHGSETPERCAAAPVKAIKAIRVGTGFDTGVVEPYRALGTAVLLDTYDPQSDGGTGKTFSWQSVLELPGRASVVLAGGLTPENVGDAIAVVRPWAVDVSSGVESAPGIKDHALIEAFVAAVREADAAIADAAVREADASHGDPASTAQGGPR